MKPKQSLQCLSHTDDPICRGEKAQKENGYKIITLYEKSVIIKTNWIVLDYFYPQEGWYKYKNIWQTVIKKISLR